MYSELNTQITLVFRRHLRVRIKYVQLPGILSNVSPHGIDDCCGNEAVFDDERVEVRTRVLKDVSHDVVSAAGEVVG